MSNARDKKNTAKQPVKADSHQVETWLADGRQVLGYDQIKVDINRMRFDEQMREILAAFLGNSGQQSD